MNALQEQRGYVQSSDRSLNLETETAVVLGNVDRQLTTLTANLESKETKGAMDDEREKNETIVKDLKLKSRILRQDQQSFLDQMKQSLDEVTKTQENVTKLLKSICKCIVFYSYRLLKMHISFTSVLLI